MKLAVDRVLCSMYAIQPDLFSNLLERLGIILPIVDTSTKDWYAQNELLLYFKNAL